MYPHRPALFRYCLSLTRNPFDADDLVSETIIKTFTSQAYVTDGIDSYIAFMIRTASRTWIDGQRRASHSTPDQSEAASQPEDLKTLEEAAEVLYTQYNPTERAVLVLSVNVKKPTTPGSVLEPQSTRTGPSPNVGFHGNPTTNFHV